MSAALTRKRKHSDAAMEPSAQRRHEQTGSLIRASPAYVPRDPGDESLLQPDHGSVARWDHCTAQDHARVQYGHTYIQNQYTGPREGQRELAKDDRVDSFVAALNFVHMDSRCDSIDPAHIDTCRWLFEKQQYLRWSSPQNYDQHHGFLWIKGKAGTGKSTIMKCALDHAKDTSEPSSVMSFFFNARGGNLERSVEGMYRSLLSQSLRQYPKIRTKFQAVAPQTVKQEEWSVPALRNYFHKVVSFLEEDETMILYIDALDECDEDEIREALEHFEDLGTLAVTRGAKLRICFASRYYPQITIRHCVEIELEAQMEHQRDIDAYIENKLTVRDPVLRSKLAYRIQRQCSGVFFWVVLVIRMLKKKSDQGACNSDLLRTLDEIPLRLRELIASILDAPDDVLLSTMQWMLFAREGLTLQQLYFAIRTSAGQLKSGMWDPGEVALDAMESFVLASSRGLIEVPRERKYYGRPQFIHESVREYLLADGLARMKSPTLSDTNTTAQGQAQLARWCQAYARLDSQAYLEYGKEVEEYRLDDDWNDRREKLCYDLKCKFPLIFYATSNVFHHLQVSYDAASLDLHSLTGFPLASWVTLTRIMHEGVPRLPCLPASLLYLLIIWRCDTLLIAILEARAASSQQERSSSSANDCACDIFGSILDLNIRFQGLHSSLLEQAVVEGSYEVARSLLLYGAEADTCNGEALFNATLNNDPEMIELLLKFGASPNARGLKPDEGAVLTLAARLGNLGIVKILLEHGADPNSAGDDNDVSPLLGALGYNGYMDDYDDEYDDNLYYHEHSRSQEAMATDKDEIIRTLLFHGAMVDRPIQGTSTQGDLTPIVYAVCHQTPAIVQLLFDHGQQTPRMVPRLLLCAAEHLNARVVRFLLEIDSPENARRLCMQEALQSVILSWNSRRFAKHVEDGVPADHARLSIIRMLLNAGANANAMHGDFETPLIAASYLGIANLTLFLIQRGVNIHHRSRRYGTAIDAALSMGHEFVYEVFEDYM